MRQWGANCRIGLFEGIGVRGLWGANVQGEGEGGIYYTLSRVIAIQPIFPNHEVSSDLAVQCYISRQGGLLW